MFSCHPSLKGCNAESCSQDFSTGWSNRPDRAYSEDCSFYRQGLRKAVCQTDSARARFPRARESALLGQRELVEGLTTMSRFDAERSD